MKFQFLLLSYFFLSLLKSENNNIYHIPIQGTIDMGLPYYIERVINEAEKNNTKVIIFDIDTFGGRIDAATKIKDIILDSKVTTIAFINKRAISAGALISLSCDSIFMTPGASIGAATAVDLKGNKASEKVLSYMREEMASTAEAKNRSREIAAGMVDEDLSINIFINSNGDTLRTHNVEGFIKGKLITLSTNLALQLDIADKEIDSFERILDYLKLDNSIVIKSSESWSEILVRFLTNPTVSPLFMSLGMLALFMEIKSPGLGIPGLIGVICIGLFFGSHLLVGLADWTEILILIIGILLFLLEILVIPGFGIAGITGIGLVFYSFFKMLLGTYPSNEDYNYAYFGLSIGIICSIITSIIFYNALPKTKLYQKLIPFNPQRSSDGFTISKGFETLIGKEGITVTDLRPSGKIKLQGKLYQASSYGDYINKNVKILVDGINENQLLVKKII